MKNLQTISHAFVEFLPEKLEDGKLYVCMNLATIAHKCCCGCGHEVVTPLSPTDWKLTYDGETITLYPSIGNWGFPCRSHYWIRSSRVQWAPKWSKEEIGAGRDYDRTAKERYFDLGEMASGTPAREPAETRTAPQGVWGRVKGWWRK